MRTLLTLVTLASCGTEPNPGDGSGVAPMSSGEQPAFTRDAASTAAWLATGEYTTWHCEDASHPARPGSGHSRNRICSNDLASTTPSGTPFPIGAATVKELLDSSDRIVGFAFAEKAGASDGGRGWYWYEVVGGSMYAASYGASLCTGCHRGASHDFLFTVVQ